MKHYDQKEVYKYLIHKLNQSKIRHEIHEFGSGAIMVDIWHNNFFYVVQIDERWVGVSKIDDNDTGFDTIPDIKLFTVEEFVNKIKPIFRSRSAPAG